MLFSVPPMILASLYNNANRQLGCVAFTKAELKALLAHTAKDETRPHVSSIFFDSAALEVAATDGHRLLLCNADGTAGPWNYLLPGEIAESAARHPKAESFVLDAAANTIEVYGKSPRNGCPARKLATLDAVNVDAQFPPYRQVIPTPTRGTGVPAGFDADYLSDIALVQAATTVDDGVKCNKVIAFPPNNTLDPVKFVCGPWTLVIMPVSFGNEYDPIVLAHSHAYRSPTLSFLRDVAAVLIAHVPTGAAARVADKRMLPASDLPGWVGKADRTEPELRSLLDDFATFAGPDAAAREAGAAPQSEKATKRPKPRLVPAPEKPPVVEGPVVEAAPAIPAPPPSGPRAVAGSTEPYPLRLLKHENKAALTALAARQPVEPVELLRLVGFGLATESGELTPKGIATARALQSFAPQLSRLIAAGAPPVTRPSSEMMRQGTPLTEFLATRDAEQARKEGRKAARQGAANDGPAQARVPASARPTAIEPPAAASAGAVKPFSLSKLSDANRGHLLALADGKPANLDKLWVLGLATKTGELTPKGIATVAAIRAIALPEGEEALDAFLDETMNACA